VGFPFRAQPRSQDLFFLLHSLTTGNKSSRDPLRLPFFQLPEYLPNFFGKPRVSVLATLLFPKAREWLSKDTSSSFSSPLGGRSRSPRSDAKPGPHLKGVPPPPPLIGSGDCGNRLAFPPPPDVITSPFLLAAFFSFPDHQGEFSWTIFLPISIEWESFSVVSKIAPDLPSPTSTPPLPGGPVAAEASLPSSWRSLKLMPLILWLAKLASSLVEDSSNECFFSFPAPSLPMQICH